MSHTPIKSEIQLLIFGILIKRKKMTKSELWQLMVRGKPDHPWSWYNMEQALYALEGKGYISLKDDSISLRCDHKPFSNDLVYQCNAYNFNVYKCRICGEQVEYPASRFGGYIGFP